MNDLTTTLLALVGSGAGVILAGLMLARSGDVIAAKTRLGALWVGSIFLALATSLPELVTAGAAVRIGAVDLAAGDLFGSNMANMLILALINLLPRSELFRRATLDHALSASLAIVITGVASVFVVLRAPPVLGSTGPGALVLLLIFAGGSRLIFRHTRTAQEAGARAELSGAEDEEAGTGAGKATAGEPALDADTGPDRKSAHTEPEAHLAPAVWKMVGASLVILVVAPLFAGAADRTATLTGLEESFVGTVLVAVATSLPELVTSLAAARMGAYDLAVGNLFGSNAVNMMLFAPLDLLHGGGPVLASVSLVHAVAGLASIVMMALGLAAIVYRAKGRFSMLEPSTLSIALVYLISVALVFGWDG